MGRYDKTCIICGKHYEYCSNCDQFIHYPAYMQQYCSQECVDLYELLVSYAQGQTDKETARTLLSGMNQDKLRMLKRSLATTCAEIMGEADAKAEPKPEVTKVDIDVQTATDTVKKAVYENTRESTKIIPRSIAYKKKHRN